LRAAPKSGLSVTVNGPSTLSGRGEPDPALCIAVDVLGERSSRPTGAFGRKLRNVEDACAEIAAMWPTINVPADYDGPGY
jgi:hypothetical protein